MIHERMGRGIDRLVGIFSPKRMAERLAYREMGKRLTRFSATYDGAAKGRQHNRWRPGGGSADADLDPDTLASLRERSRDRMRNDGVATACVGSLCDNIVGTGIYPRLRLDAAQLGISQPRADALAREARGIWRRWAPHADLTGHLDIHDMQSLLLASVLYNGDAFVQPVMRETPESPYSLRLEMIEADRIATPTTLNRKERTVRDGVELNRSGRPVAYWVSLAHPGDDDSPGVAFSTGRREFRRVAAASDATGRRNMLHLYRQNRIGQTRGEPVFAPVLKWFKDLGDYMEAEVIAAQVAACFAVFITKNDPIQAAVARATTASKTGTGDREEELSPAAMYYLQPGESVDTANPNRPNTNFGAFVDRCIRFICTGLGLPYEVATRDFSGTTYSQARASILEARRMFQVRQQFLVRYLLQPVWQMVLEEAWLRGDFAADDFLGRVDAWTETAWVTPGWGWIDPQKEVAAASAQLDMGITTREHLAAVNGFDFEQVTRQLADEQELRTELLGAGLPASQPSEDGGDDAEESADDEQEPAGDQEDDADGEADDDADADGDSLSVNGQQHPASVGGRR